MAAEHWKSLVRTVVSCHKDEDLDRFLADPSVHSEFRKFEAILRSSWKRVMGPVPRLWVAPMLEPDPPKVAPQMTPIPPRPKDLPANSAPADPLPLAEQIPAVPIPAPLPVPPAVSRLPATPPASPPPAASSAQQTPLPPKLPPRPVLQFKLKNGRQSEAFSGSLECATPGTDYRLVKVSIPPELSLTCALKTGVIEGRPAASGDFRLRVQYRFQSDPPDAVREAEVSFYVNPDPKLLWKNLSSDRADPLWKEDETAQILAGPQRRIVAARKRGRSHAHVGSCCDDDFFIHHDAAQDWYVAIVADGAGSAKASRQGSRLAVRAAGQHIRQTLAGEEDGKIAAAVAGYLEATPETRDIARQILHNSLYVVVGHAAYKAMKALVDEAEARPELIGALKNLSTTLLIGIAKKFGDRWLCASYWVGDGAVGVYQQHQGIELLGEVDSGEYSGQTRFLDRNEVSSEALAKRTRFTLCEDFTGFLLMTDGVSDPKFETEARLAQVEAWDDLWADLQAGAGLSDDNPEVDQKLLAWLDFWSQGNHDDRTIAIIY